MEMENDHLEVTRMADEARENSDVVRNPTGLDSDSSSNSDVNVHPDSDSDGDSATSEVTSTELASFTDGGLVRVSERDEQDQFVRQKFVDVMFALGLRTVVKTVSKNVCTSLTWQAKLRSFSTMSRFMEKIGKGCGSVKYAWFGGSRDEINNIVRHGFASRGRGICLSPFYSPLSSLSGCVVDENGLCHIILCHVILGRSELVSPDSQQRFPSSEEFHSGVDNLSSPRVYMVWSTHMNTHIIPQYVISFRPPVPVEGKEGVEDAAEGPSIGRKPNHLIPYPVLLRELAMVLPIDTIKTLQKLHHDYREGKIMKSEMYRKLRQLAGDDVLYRTIMSLKRKHVASEKATPRDSNNFVQPQINSRKFAPNNSSRVVLPKQSGLRSSSNRVLKKLRGARSA